jgi:hypothetical protein
MNAMGVMDALGVVDSRDADALAELLAVGEPSAGRLDVLDMGALSPILQDTAP